MRSLLVLTVLVAGCGSSGLSTPQHDGGAGDLSTVPVPDAAGSAGFPCNAFTGKGCQPGLHCTIGLIGDNGADVCVADVPSPILEGGACAQIGFGGYTGDYCTPGTACIKQGGISKCRKPCFVHDDCKNGDTCAAVTSSPTTIKDRMKMDIPLSGCIASDGCDLVMQSGCPIGLGCYLSGPDDVGRAILCEMPLGMLPPAATCASQRDCAPGETCSGLGFCRRVCYIAPTGSKGICPASEGSCNPFFGSAGIYGECE